MMKKIFVDNLPKWGGGLGSGRGIKGNIKWKESIGIDVTFIYNGLKGTIKIIAYSNKYLTVSYNDIEHKVSTSAFISGKLGNILNKHTSNFKIEIGHIFNDNNRNIIITYAEHRKIKRNNNFLNAKWYKYTCNECGWEEGWIEESCITRGCGCSCCANQTVVEGINDIPTTAPWMIPYFQGGYEEARLYTRSSGQKIYPICPDCSEVRYKTMGVYAIYKSHSIGCTCSDEQSYPNKLSYSLLNQLNEIYEFQIFETEYSPDWIKPKRYDFYFELNNEKYILEMDGGFHVNDNFMNGQTKEESKEIDDYKDEIAKEHNVEVIRIDCRKSDLAFIKNNILHSKLSYIFNMKYINWDKCEKFALSNLVKIACELKKENNNLSTIEIGKIIGLQGQTICEYLKKGVSLNWCEYDIKKEKEALTASIGRNNGKKIEIFKNSLSLGLFESCSELMRQSKRLFGIKLDRRGVGDVCKGIREQYKDFTFKYI